jgi:N-carbamoylputrescine amidase
MKVTVCELGNDSDALAQDWQSLVAHTKSEASDLVLLPEMAFHPWVAQTDQVDSTVWQAAVDAHDQWMPRLAELAPAIVAGSRPIVQQKKRLNEGFIWEKASGYQAVHHKYYLPDEKDFWEASWYDRGEYEFSVAQANQVRMGFLICTELWFNSHGREYGKQEIHLLVSPRATPAATTDKWIAGGRAAAVVSGAFCLSSNFGGISEAGIKWGGSGWIIEPEEGEVLGVTSQEQPFLTLDIDLKVAETAKRTYPRYVLD